jgi:hypothetical protein
VDLGDEADPVMMLDKGEELDQIEESLPRLERRARRRRPRRGGPSGNRRRF